MPDNQAAKTLLGKWRTPLPIEFIDDPDTQVEGQRCFVTKKGHIKISVEKKIIELNDSKKVQRFLTLTETSSGFQMTGKSNIKYDRITWDNGATWARYGATKRDRDEIDQDARAMSQHAGGEPPVEYQDAVLPAGLCSLFLCGSQARACIGDIAMPVYGRSATADAPPPRPSDLSEGFFNNDDIEDIIDRINEVVGIWGVSEDTEREYIKPPVIALNKLIKSAMESFMDSPLVDLFQYIMDEAMDVMEKAKRIGQFLSEKIVQPLTAALMERLTDDFKALSYVRNQVDKMVRMMAHLVTDQLVTKTVEQLQDSDAVN